MQAQADARDAANDLLNLKIRGADGQLVPLSSLLRCAKQPVQNERCIITL